jgi:RHS repeat-associated protein
VPTLLTTFKGYTGHERVDAVGLIHMGGRIYDPTLGRFLSPDSVVQASADLQSLDRYSYVANNPLSATEPSGHSLSGLFNAIGDALDWANDNWRTIAVVAVTVMAP